MPFRKYFFLIITLFMGVLSNAQSPNAIAQRVSSYQQQKNNFTKLSLFENYGHFTQQQRTRNVVKEYDLLSINQATRDKIIEETPIYLSIDIPFEDKVFSVELYQVDIHHPSFQIETPQGVYPSSLSSIHYRGIVHEDHHSIVTLSVNELEIIANISTKEKGNIVIGKWDEISKDMLIAYSDTDLLLENNFLCSELQHQQSFDTTLNYKRENQANCVLIFIEADYALFQNKGTVEATENWIAAMFNQVAAIYELEGIEVKLSSVFVWNVPDPYPTDFANNALTTFRTQRSFFKGDLAQLIALGPTGLGGTAYVNTLCFRNLSYSYSNIVDSYNGFPTYSWTVNLVAHELGHNLGSSHTHECKWNGNNTQIDDCGNEYYHEPNSCYDPSTPILPEDGGTIMSYCHLLKNIGVNFNKGFGPQPGNLIREKVANADCLDCTVEEECTLEISSIDVTPTTCDLNNGTATIMVSGTLQNVKYSIGKGVQSQNIFKHLNPGKYNLIVYSNDCTIQGTFVVEKGNVKPIVTASSLPETCNLQNGQISIHVNGGKAPYEYFLNGEDIEQRIIENVHSGEYIIHVVDDNLCEATVEVSVPDVAKPEVGFTVEASKCGLANGSISVTAQGGKSPYYYTLNDQSSELSQFEHLEGGMYNLKVEDATGCINESTVEIGSSERIVAEGISTQSDCGKNNGSITLTPSSGNGPLKYSIGTGFQDEPHFKNLGGGQYTVTIRDINDCFVELPITVEELHSFDFEVNSSHTICGEDNGGLSVSLPDTGEFLISFDTNPFQSKSEFEFLAAGNHSIRVRGEDGCILTQSVNINPSYPVSSELNVNQPRCGLNNGVIEVDAIGGSEKYQYFVNNDPIENDSLTDLAPGEYLVIVMDSSGCIDSNLIYLETSTSPEITTNITSASCLKKNGSIQILAINGIEPFQYAINDCPFQKENLFSQLDSGSYRISIIDDHQCQDSTIVFIAYDDGFKKPVLGPDTGLCPGTNIYLEAPINNYHDINWYRNGALMLESINEIIEVTVEGQYIIESVYDEECILSDTIQITLRSSPEYQIADSFLVCHGDLITFHDSAYQFSWRKADFGRINSFEKSALYNFIVQNEFNCSDTLQSYIEVIPEVDLRDNISKYFACDGDSITIRLSGASDFIWFNNDDILFHMDSILTVLAKPEDQIFFVLGSNECFSDTLLIEAEAYPEEQILTEDTVLVQYGLTSLSLPGTTAQNWSSNKFNLNCMNCQTIQFRPTEMGTIFYQYTDQYGCSRENQVNIDITPIEKIIPEKINLITPNGDAINDVLFFEGLEHFDTRNLVVFDHQGKIVFQQEDYQNNWDGGIKNEVPAGVYFYVLNLKINDLNFKIDSDLTIIRE